MNEHHRIPDEAAAVQAAKRFTRLGALTQKISVTRVSIGEDVTPFLSQQIVGRRAWRVVFEDVSLKLPSSIRGYPDSYRRRFIVHLDEESGQLLGVWNPFEGKDPDLLPPPSAASAEAQLRGSSEIYHGFPEAPPKLTLLDALDRVLSGGGGSPFLAKEIEGLYVMHSKLGSAPRAVWVVTLWGLPPMEVGGPRGASLPSVPAWQRNHLRNVVDATTGQVLFATTIPQPDAPPAPPAL